MKSVPTARGLAWQQAKYWKNGSATHLSNGLLNAYAGGIAVNGTDIYISGFDNGTSTASTAVYWKMGYR